MLRLILILLFSGIGLADNTESLPIPNVDEEGFDQLLKSSRFALIDFYAPWCHHCKLLEPELDKVATQLFPHANQIQLGKVNCDNEENKELCARYGIESFPSMLFFSPHTDEPVLFVETKSAPVIVRWILSQIKPLWKRIKNPLVLEDLQQSEDLLFVGIFGNNQNKKDNSYKDSEAYKSFRSLATANRDSCTFAIIQHPTAGMMRAINSRTTPMYSFYRNFRDGRTKKKRFFRSWRRLYDVTKPEPTIWSLPHVQEWFNTGSYPILGDIRPNNFKKYTARGLPLVWFFLDYKDPNILEYERSATQACGAIQSDAICCKIDATLYDNMTNHFAIKTLPAVVIQDIEVRKLYKMSPFIEKELDHFFKKWIDGDLKPTLLSQDAPISNDAALTVITGNTFDDIVFDPTQTVVVKFFAPWCGYSQALASTYLELADVFQEVDNVIIGEIDVTSNDPPIEIDHFPMIYIFPSNTDNKDGILFDGSLTKLELTNFVNKHAKVSTSSYILTISENTFESIVFDQKMWVVVKFYDPSSDDSKALDKIYDAAARKFIHVDIVVTGEIDVTSNNLPLEIDQVPSICIFPANENARNGICYKGTFGVQELNDFIWQKVFNMEATEKNAESHRHDEL